MYCEVVSIVIPSFNRAFTLHRAIDSILAQDFPVYEILIIDDCSTDNTKQVVSDIQRNSSLVKYISHSINKGAQAARNTGAKAAKGEWIIFLDSDDYLLPLSIQSRLDATRRTKAKVVHSECTVIRDTIFQPLGVTPMQGNIFKEILSRPGPMFQGMLVHRDAIKRIGYLDENIISYQEWDTSIRLAKHYEFAFVPEPTFVYDCRGSDTISKDMVRDVNGYKQVVLKHQEAILQICGRDILAEHFRHIASRYQALGLRRDYLEYLTKTLILQPSMFFVLTWRIFSKTKRFILPDSALKN
jgi:glycosyltransferase involved in cell wall biosynthesis